MTEEINEVRHFVHADDCEMSRIDASFNCTCGAMLLDAATRADAVLHFDLRRMIEFGPDYNQAVKDVADRLRSALAAWNCRASLHPPPTGEGWRPIETAPINEIVVVTNGEQAAVSALEPTDYGTHYWALEGDDGLDWQPTHWMPLPQPPAKER